MPDHHIPEAKMPKPPTAKQLAYLRTLASRTGQTFVTPKTSVQASAEIRRLKGARTQTRAERHMERQGAPAMPATTYWDHEVTGYGSTARWS